VKLSRIFAHYALVLAKMIDDLKKNLGKGL